jgi:hypothetical protein
MPISIPYFSYVALHDLVIDVSPSDRKHIYYVSASIWYHKFENCTRNLVLEISYPNEVFFCKFFF